MVDQPQRRDTGETLKLVGIIVLIVVLAALVIDNTRSVRVGFVFGDWKVPLIFVLIVTALLGALIDRLWMRRRRR